MVTTTDNKYRHIPANRLGGQISASLISCSTAWQGTQLTAAVRPTAKAADLGMGLFGR